MFMAMTPLASAATPPFPDMQKSWFEYQNAVSYLIGKKVIEGYPDGTFQPKKTVNRAELLKIIFTARGGNTPVTGSCFSDVPEDSWFAPFVCAAKRRDIVNGYSDGTFKPEQAVNFAEAIKIMLRTYGRQVTEKTGEDWFEPFADELDDDDILRRSSYIPWEPLTRERAADLITRFVRFEDERKVPNLSQGCGKAKTDVATTINVNGVPRSFLLTIPKNYKVHDPSPLIVAFHGRTNSNEQVRAYYGLDRNADDFIIAYPAALKKDNGSFSWSDPSDKASGIRDVAFFDAIVEHLATELCVDMDEIYTVGHSLGAWMANTVACVRGGIVRGSATVGGDGVITDCSGPTASMMINNPHDSLSPFKSAVAIRDMRLKENACLTDTKPMPPDSLKCQKYVTCDGGNTVVWCPHENDIDSQGNNYPHNWPLSAADAMVSFFKGLK